MCSFKPGDEVVCVGMDDCPEMIGQTYVIETVFIHQNTGHAAVTLEGEDNGDPSWDADPRPFYGFSASRFRKVQKRNDRLTIEAFMTIKDGQPEEPKRSPNKKKVEA